ncbi:glycosyltransferase [Moraxella oblonga]|uniref:glycosyltransferase n=1 Tax=Moraxella oblonga TaxID=200413 RepID=UPI000836D98D|nr:glycosyltransferase [Moraxella oblonga]
MNPTVAIITSTVGRKSLLRTIKSVQNQSYPCKHYIFVDGKQYHKTVKNMVKAYPDVEVVYLPMNTGGGANELMNSTINAIAPYLVEEEIIFYLDDDNWYDDDHVKTLVTDMQTHHADYAYALRYCVDEKQQIICPDDTESLGFWSAPKTRFYPLSIQIDDIAIQTGVYSTLSFDWPYLIDVNCFAMRRALAQSLSTIWVMTGCGNDRNITKHLFSHPQLIGICSGRYTVYYYIDITKYNQVAFDDSIAQSLDLTNKPHREYLIQLESFKVKNNIFKLENQDEFGKTPWQYKTMFKHDEQDAEPKLFRLE